MEVSWTHDFAITVTLNRLQKRLEPLKQFDISSRQLSSMLSHSSSIREVALRASIVTELTVNSDIHYHAIVKCEFRNSIRSYKIYLENLFRKSKIFGFICVKPIDNYGKWTEYMSKDIQKTYNELGVNPIVIDDYNIYSKDIILSLMINSESPTRRMSTVGVLERHKDGV